MVRHSVVVYRNDNPVGAQQVSFSGDAWPGYVPIRMTDTICVQERLPPGTAAVLINRTHTYTDLIAPIDGMEKHLFDAIDGNCSLGHIVERTWRTSQGTSRPDMARRFFERLWWYDQVVFDTSGTTRDGRESARSSP
jgi:hypothetical protein